MNQEINKKVMDKETNDKETNKTTTTTTTTTNTSNTNSKKKKRRSSKRVESNDNIQDGENVESKEMVQSMKKLMIQNKNETRTEEESFGLFQKLKVQPFKTNQIIHKGRNSTIYECDSGSIIKRYLELNQFKKEIMLLSFMIRDNNNPFNFNNSNGIIQINGIDKDKLSMVIRKYDCTLSDYVKVVQDKNDQYLKQLLLGQLKNVNNNNLDISNLTRQIKQSIKLKLDNIKEKLDLTKQIVQIVINIHSIPIVHLCIAPSGFNGAKLLVQQPTDRSTTASNSDQVQVQVQVQDYSFLGYSHDQNNDGEDEDNQDSGEKQLHSVVGIPPYMPPQAVTRVYSLKYDHFSLAMVIYSIFEREEPYSEYVGDNVHMLMDTKFSTRPSFDHTPAIIKESIEPLWSKLEKERPELGDVMEKLEGIIHFFNSNSNFGVVIKSLFESSDPSIYNIICQIIDDDGSVVL